MNHLLTKSIETSSVKILAGTLLMLFFSSIKIPFIPVPFTLQTLAVFVIGVTLKPKEAALSILIYLLLGSVGLPVFSGMQANVFWITSKSGGYLISFPLAAFAISLLYKKFPVLIAIFCGQIIIYFFGFIWLSFFLDLKTAFTKGVLIFLPSSFIKMGIAWGFTQIKQRNLQ